MLHCIEAFRISVLSELPGLLASARAKFFPVTPGTAPTILEGLQAAMQVSRHGVHSKRRQYRRSRFLAERPVGSRFSSSTLLDPRVISAQVGGADRVGTNEPKTWTQAPMETELPSARARKACGVASGRDKNFDDIPSKRGNSPRDCVLPIDIVHSFLLLVLLRGWAIRSMTDEANLRVDINARGDDATVSEGYPEGGLRGTSTLN